MPRLARARTAVRRLMASLLAAAACTACGQPAGEGVVVRFSGSALGAEAEVLRAQLARFMEANPGIRVEIQPTPDAADQRHQLYVQWLNARAGDPDVLQLDVIWTPEFAAAGWILPLDRFAPPVDSFFPATIEANRWRGRLFALPWFVDVGMLYWRTDLLPRAPETFEELRAFADEARARGATPYGFVWQGARYEGLVTVFLEHLGGFGGAILDADGRVVVDEEPAVRALECMRGAVESGLVPRAALTWQEEQTRFAFQNGQAVLMRNWPYAYALLADSAQSRVAGRFAVAPMPAAPGGEPTAALGGAQLAVNAYTEHPEAAYAVIEYLTRPEQMLERARVVGQYPTRPALYDDPALAASLAVPPAQARAIIARAEPRPVTPVYTQLSELLQVRLHRALTGQQEPAAALADAAREMRRLLERAGLGPGASVAAGVPVPGGGASAEARVAAGR
ncbi:MAG TPA: ABC transporter substrate-binding protein [Longimicrobiales bacterium]